MVWALIIIFVLLQAVAFLVIRKLDQRFGINDWINNLKWASPRRTAPPFTFMIWYVAGFFNFFIALSIAALYFN